MEERVEEINTNIENLSEDVDKVKGQIDTLTNNMNEKFDLLTKSHIKASTDVINTIKKLLTEVMLLKEAYENKLTNSDIGLVNIKENGKLVTTNSMSSTLDKSTTKKQHSISINKLFKVLWQYSGKKVPCVAPYNLIDDSEGVHTFNLKNDNGENISFQEFFFTKEGKDEADKVIKEKKAQGKKINENDQIVICMWKKAKENKALEEKMQSIKREFNENKGSKTLQENNQVTTSQNDIVV